MSNLFTHIDHVAGLVQAVALAIVSISAALAAMGVKKSALQRRMERAAELAVQATEQWRKLRQQSGLADPDAATLKAHALELARQQVPEADPKALACMIEAKVNRQATPAVPAPAR